jgi:hypothetical protein
MTPSCLHAIATISYIEAALWSSHDDHGVPLDVLYGPAHLSEECEASMREDVGNFIDLLEIEGVDWSDAMTPESLGRDFWLTRNRHGAGFWDRGVGDLGDTLTSWAHTFGSVDLVVGDDGSIHAA